MRQVSVPGPSVPLRIGGSYHRNHVRQLFSVVTCGMMWGDVALYFHNGESNDGKTKKERNIFEYMY